LLIRYCGITNIWRTLGRSVKSMTGRFLDSVPAHKQRSYWLEKFKHQKKCTGRYLVICDNFYFNQSTKKGT
jgi:hypothetical protein